MLSLAQNTFHHNPRLRGHVSSDNRNSEYHHIVHHINDMDVLGEPSTECLL